MFLLAIKRLRENNLPLPAYQTAEAAGIDLAADLSWDKAPEYQRFIIPQAYNALGNLRLCGIFLPPSERIDVLTGFAFAIPSGFEGQMRPRSGLAREFSLTLINAPATIDADYRGEVRLLLINHGKRQVWIKHGMRLAQLVIAPIVRAELIEVDALSETARGEGGYGSTGK